MTRKRREELSNQEAYHQRLSETFHPSQLVDSILLAGFRLPGLRESLSVRFRAPWPSFFPNGLTGDISFIMSHTRIHRLERQISLRLVEKMVKTDSRYEERRSLPLSDE